MYASPIVSREAGMGTPNHGRGLPPVGNFAPTPNAKDNKRKRNERQGTANEMDQFVGQNAVKPQIVGPAGKVCDSLKTRSMLTITAHEAESRQCQGS